MAGLEQGWGLKRKVNNFNSESISIAFKGGDVNISGNLVMYLMIMHFNHLSG